MPLKLSKATQFTIDAVRIAGLNVALDPLIVVVDYERGTMSGGDFVVIDRGSAKFSADDIAGVDPKGDVRGSVRSALYSLLQSRLGSGKVT